MGQYVICARRADLGKSLSESRFYEHCQGPHGPKLKGRLPRCTARRWAGRAVKDSPPVPRMYDLRLGAETYGT